MSKSPAKRQNVRVVVMPHGRDLPLPKYQTPGAAGLDLVAAIPADDAAGIRFDAPPRVSQSEGTYRR